MQIVTVLARPGQAVSVSVALTVWEWGLPVIGYHHHWRQVARGRQGSPASQGTRMSGVSLYQAVLEKLAKFLYLGDIFLCSTFFSIFFLKTAFFF